MIQLLLISTFLVFLLFYTNTIFKETFKPWNSKDVVDEPTGQGLDNNSDVELLKIFKEFPTIPVNYKQIYTKYPKFIRIKTLLSKLLTDVVNRDLQEIFKNTNYKNVALHDLNDIYWLDSNNENAQPTHDLATRHYIFTGIITSKVNFFAKRVLIHVVLNNVSQYLSPDRDLWLDKIKVDSSDLKTISIKLDNTQSILLGESVTGELADLKLSHYTADKLGFENFHEIKNTLYLTEPYITSHDENGLNISETQKQKFSQALKNKQIEQIVSERKTNCFDIDTGIEIQECGTNTVRDYLPYDSTGCPFYKENENYSNDFGKLTIKGCELPLNMKRIGYRYYSFDPNNEPLCYNCKTNLIGDGTLGHCCKNQLDRTEYPYLLSPDYAFLNDQNIRKQQESQFKQKNLNIS